MQNSRVGVAAGPTLAWSPPPDEQKSSDSSLAAVASQAATVAKRQSSLGGGSPEQAFRLRWPPLEQAQAPSSAQSAQAGPRDVGVWMSSSTAVNRTSLSPLPSRSESPLPGMGGWTAARAAGHGRTTSPPRSDVQRPLSPTGAETKNSDIPHWMRPTGESASSALRATLTAGSKASPELRMRQPAPPGTIASALSRSSGGDLRSRDIRPPEGLTPTHTATSSSPPALGNRHLQNSALQSMSPILADSQEKALGKSGSPSMLSSDALIGLPGRLLVSEELRQRNSRSPVASTRATLDKAMESPPHRPQVEARADSLGPDPADWNGLLTVFLLPNLKESDDFMQTVFSAFAEDCPRVADTSVVQIRNGDANGREVLLQHLGPVDALEDVQRRARRAAASLLRRWALSWGREFGLELTGPRKSPAPLRRQGQKPRFSLASGLPKVESQAAAGSTMLVYFVRPFESAKDAERQLGPICIVEASYHGASHTHVPRRIVVAVEESPEATEASTTGSLGSFGCKVQERLRQRGVDLPVTSVDKRSITSHRDLLNGMASTLVSEVAQERPTRPTTSTKAPMEDSLATSLSSTTRESLGLSSSLSDKGLNKDMLARFIPCTQAEKDAFKKPKTEPLERPFLAEAAARSKSPQASVPPPPPPSVQASTRDLEALSPEKPCGVPAAVASSPPAKSPKKLASSPSLEPRECLPRGAAPNLVPPPSAAEPAPSSPKAEQQQQQDFAASSTAAQAPPLIQVGEATFSLPPPGLAVKRIGELWRPGASMVVITTDHFGTPLFCPNGDVRNGLINVAPSSKDGKQLVPLFWRNVAEDSQSSTPAASTGSKRHTQNRMTPTAASHLPTMVEEEE
eukprot:CAMPEP_0178391874 /NCGR_PEP_ID=MMETSP0689_2-20121128/11388_1 /TAXON_ID=160604 /ORGANISM="Amphidinium massartii, Strain CS-259" /LENGTH=856 /DNA_ID=CAMNT_0020012431 /DNA_START=35 /DNA_END=2602 /DNA_ORIENTATION=+